MTPKAKAKAKKDSAPGYPIESVNNALRLLLMLREQPHLRLTQASTALGVGPSTAHRLLAMLEYRDLVRNDQNLRAYVAGQALTDVGLAVVQRLTVRALAHPILRRLQEETTETAHLALLAGPKVLYLDSVESSRGLRVTPRTGRSLPAHCTSVGKAMLATLTEDEFNRLYPEEDLATATVNSIATRTDLRRALWTIRSSGGVARNREESELGVGSVGVVVPKAAKGRLAGLSLAVPTLRLTDALAQEHAEKLTAAAAELAEAMTKAEASDAKSRL
jgi:DNA-binding IclR family transcriptional regulator